VSTTSTNTLTPRQQDVRDWIAGYIDTHGFSPSVREIGHAYGWTTNGVMCHLRAMRKKNAVTWLDGQARTIRVTGGDA
jgi:repressor LexA